MTPPVGLTLEQQLRLRTFADEVAAMNLEQRRERLVTLYTDMMIIKNAQDALLQQRWGIRNSCE